MIFITLMFLQLIEALLVRGVDNCDSGFEILKKTFSYEGNIMSCTDNSNELPELMVQRDRPYSGTMASTTLSSPGARVQIPVTFMPTLAKSALKFSSLLSRPANPHIMIMSDAVLIHDAPCAGMTLSWISTLLYPGVMAGLSARRISRHFSSVQSWN